jgi:hypothetical protein
VRDSRPEGRDGAATAVCGGVGPARSEAEGHAQGLALLRPALHQRAPVVSALGFRPLTSSGGRGRAFRFYGILSIDRCDPPDWICGRVRSQ